MKTPFWNVTVSGSVCTLCGSLLQFAMMFGITLCTDAASEVALSCRRQGVDVSWASPGRIHLSRDGTRLASLVFFLWHDDWQYQPLDAGTHQSARKGPNGVVYQRGNWGNDAHTIPVDYDATVTIAGDGIDVGFSARKRGPIALADGVWCRLELPDDGREVRSIQPFGGVSSGLRQTYNTMTDGIRVGLDDGVAVVLSLPGASAFRSTPHDDGYAFELKLIDELPDSGESKQTRFAIDVQPSSPVNDDVAEVSPALSLGALELLTPNVTRFNTVELAVPLVGTWENPYDPEAIRVDATIRYPSGRTIVQPGFFMRPHRRDVIDGAEVWRAAPEGEWRVRLAPDETGLVDVAVTATTASGETRSSAITLNVDRSTHHGFVRRHPNVPHFVLDTGQHIVAIGHNQPIYPISGELIEQAIERMAAAGENCLRVWMSRDSLGVEWADRLGWYRQEAAAKLDYLLETASKHGVYVIISLDTHHDFQDHGWLANPYRRRNGGPCSRPHDWFSKPAAKRHYQKRLRYIVARWSYATTILCWELGNEFEGWPDSSEKLVLSWHREMARFLKRIDPNKHLITTSWWQQSGPAATWDIADIDIVQSHWYANSPTSIADNVQSICNDVRTIGKPHLFGEFSIRSDRAPIAEDPAGWSVHNALWAGVSSGAAGGPLLWWYEEHLRQGGLAHHFTAIRQWLNAAEFQAHSWKPLAETSVHFDGGNPRPGDVVLVPGQYRHRAGEHCIVVDREGEMDEPQLLNEVLYGVGKRQNRFAFVVDYLIDGEFTVGVGRVANAGRLLIHVDGNRALDRRFPAGKGFGKGGSEDVSSKVWQSEYGVEATISIPAGTHRIEVRNAGIDWLRVNYYRMTNCRATEPDLLVSGLRHDGHALVWVHNRSSTWYKHAFSVVPTIVGANVSISNWPNGRYQVEWWQTWNGSRIRTDVAETANGRLLIEPGPVMSDVAAIIRPQQTDD